MIFYRPKKRIVVTELYTVKEEDLAAWQRARWRSYPPSYLDAKLTDAKGFVKMYSLPFPPEYTWNVPVIPRMTVVPLTEDVPVMLNIETLEFDFKGYEYDEIGNPKTLLYEERRR